ncbi:MAG: dephospho-CoA kinase [Lachnospiraceae bacterium]|nr:dephospho-CoA kinase [Lachnospiraceae bacterium]
MVIGVTGGVGAGKSTVLMILEKNYNAKIIMADDVAKELMEPGGASYEAVVNAFGEDILVSSEESSIIAEEESTDYDSESISDQAELKRPIDRKKLAEIIFNDDEKLALVNSLTHPKVKEEILSRIDNFYLEDEDALIVVEAALLIEAGYEDILDSLWIVTVDTEVRIERLMRDRGYTREKCLSIMDNQLSDEEFTAHADVIINNSYTLENTEEQVAEAIHNCIRSKEKESK